MRSTTPGTPEAGTAPSPPPPVAAESVLQQMERVLASVHFRSSRRCQTLLKHIVERTLAGDTPSLKERVLGVDVFERATDYDTSEDPVVRTTAAEVRKKLAQYYQEPQQAAELKIELHPGSYVPEFHSPEPAVGIVSTAPEVTPRRWGRRTGIALGAVAVIATAVWLASPLWQPSPFERFWSPMLTAPGSVLFCVGQPRAFNLVSDAKQIDLEHEIEGLPRQSLESSKETIPLKELVPMWDRYVALGDAACLLRLSAVFERRGKAYRLRGGGSTSFSDLREGPAVLIGAFDNEWTLRLLGELRYTFYKTRDGQDGVRDRDHPERSEWKLMNSWPYWKISNDYAIVSRVLDRNTDRMIVSAAGITHFGTAGAGEFLGDAAYFGEAVPRLPRDWYKRNMQIVLSVPVVHGASGHPRVLAVHVW